MLLYLHLVLSSQVLDNRGHPSYTCLHRVMVHGSFVEEMIDARLEEKDVMDTGLEEGESLVVESNPLARESLQSEL